MSNERTALVLGATGGVGGEIARQLQAAGWKVTALKRGSPGPAASSNQIAWIAGDAFARTDVVSAAQGASVIVHAVNPPGYRNWSQLVLPMMDNSLAAATATGATVVLPGTVYNYGPDAFPVLREDSPQHPRTRKGAIRVQMEQRLQAFAQRGGRALVVRAGDFFGPGARNNWFSQGLVQPGSPVTTIRNPGRIGVGHAWSYLPDVARTVVELLAKGSALEPFATFHMAGHHDEDGMQMAAAIRSVVARRMGTEPRIASFPWWAIPLAAPFNTSLREMLEMRYLWQQTVRLDNTRLVAALGREPHTALEEAIEATLQGLGCLVPVAGAVSTAA